MYILLWLFCFTFINKNIPKHSFWEGNCIRLQCLLGNVSLTHESPSGLQELANFTWPNKEVDQLSKWQRGFPQWEADKGVRNTILPHTFDMSSDLLPFPASTLYLYNISMPVKAGRLIFLQDKDCQKHGCTVTC